MLTPVNLSSYAVILPLWAILMMVTNESGNNGNTWGPFQYIGFYLRGTSGFGYVVMELAIITRKLVGNLNLRSHYS